MKVCFIYSNRSEYSKLLPFIEYFQQKTSTKVLNLSEKIKNIEDDKNLSKVYSKCYEELSREKCDYVCVLGDRRELPFVVLAAFLLRIKIVHIAAGEFTEGFIVYDEVFRPIISLLSSYQICLSSRAKKEVEKLFAGIHNISAHSYFFGDPVFRNINIGKLKRQIKENYDLVLLHPQSLSKEGTIKDVADLKRHLKDKKTIFISGNKDRNSKIIKESYNSFKRSNKKYVFLENLPKEKYFALIKYCDNFYTNASNAAEVMKINSHCFRKIGLRNKNREPQVFRNNAPERLYNLLHNKKQKM